MVSYGDARKWQDAPVDEAERLLKARSDQLVGLADELAAAANPSGWHGASADRASTEVKRITDWMEHLVAGVNAARVGLMHTADRVTELKHFIADTDGLAQAHRFSITDSGAINDAGPSPDTPPAQAEAVGQERARTKVELVERVDQIVRYATDIDTTLAKVLDDVEHGRISDGGATTLADAARVGETKSGIPGPPPNPKTDAGAGEHGSDPWYTRADDLIYEELAYNAATIADAAGWTHAAKHLNHYLNNSGDTITVNPDEMMRDAGQFRAEVDKTVTNEMRRIAAEAEANGTYGKPVQFGTDWKGHYISKGENADWFYAMGGVRYAVTGEATVHPPEHPGGEPRVEMQYKTHVFDRYNWDGGKSTDIGPITITDDKMAELHRAGVAQEYDITGSTDTKQYNGIVPPPGQQPDLPKPPDNRDGGRTDPGR
jgi:uncharacterized protein YukE